MRFKLVDNTDHWHERAAKMRAFANAAKSINIKAMMLALAKDYDRLAERARGRTESMQESTQLRPGRDPQSAAPKRTFR